MSIYPGPQPPFTNPIIAPDNFQPSTFEITSIDLGATTKITTSKAHNFVVGQNVRFHIPPPFGTRDLNTLQSVVQEIPLSNELIVSIYSVGFDFFISSPSLSNSKPQVSAIGDINTGAINSDGRASLDTDIAGSFQNIS